jgi:hypothetical protein
MDTKQDERSAEDGAGTDDHPNDWEGIPPRAIQIVVKSIYRNVTAVCLLDTGLAMITLDCGHAYMGNSDERNARPCIRCATLGPGGYPR